MVTIELSRRQARMLLAVLNSDLCEYKEGIEALHEIEDDNPNAKLGARGVTPGKAIDETTKMCRLLEDVMNQLRETKKS